MVVRLLLERPGDVDTSDKDGRTTLHVAAEKAYSQVIRLLLKKANPDVQDWMKQIALHIAARSGYVEVVQRSVEKDTDIEAKDSLDTQRCI